MLNACSTEEHAKNVYQLISMLRQGNGDIRAYAVEALGKIKDARTVDLLIKALQDDDWNIRFGAKLALVEIGEPSVRSLIEALKKKDSRVQANAADALGKINDAKAVDPLIQALRDESRKVRFNAAIALGEIKDNRAVDPLIQALKDSSDDEWWAAEALAEIGEPSVSPLIHALRESRRKVRFNAAIALGKIKDNRAVDPLIQALKDNDSQIRANAAEALGNIGDTRSVRPLIQALKDDDINVRNEAAYALDKLGSGPHTE